MTQIPTAEEIYLQITCPGNATWTENPKEVAIEVGKRMARYHVEAALQAAAEQARDIEIRSGIGYSWEIDKQSILNSYPLTNIK